MAPATQGMMLPALALDQVEQRREHQNHTEQDCETSDQRSSLSMDGCEQRTHRRRVAHELEERAPRVRPASGGLPQSARPPPAETPGDQYRGINDTEDRENVAGRQAARPCAACVLPRFTKRTAYSRPNTRTESIATAVNNVPKRSRSGTDASVIAAMLRRTIVMIDRTKYAPIGERVMLQQVVEAVPNIGLAA